MTPRKRNLYIAVLGLGLIAVAADQLFVLPDEASAGRPSGPITVTPAVPATTGAVAAPVELALDTGATDPLAAARVAIADRLDKVAQREGVDPTNVRDAFAPPAAWLQRDTGPTGPTGPTRSSAEQFREAHRLNAVMASGRDSSVIIDGRTLYIGQELDGFTLVVVRARSAVLVSKRETVELTLPER